MPIPVDCKSCRFAFQVKDIWSGRRVKCRRCGGPIAVPGEIAPDLAAKSNAPSAPANRLHPITTTQDLAAWQMLGSSDRPVTSMNLTSSASRTWEYRDPWDLAFAAQEISRRMLPRLCVRWGIPFEHYLDHYLARVLLIAAVAIFLFVAYVLFSSQPLTLSIGLSLLTALSAATFLMFLVRRAVKACSQGLRFDGAGSIPLKSTVAFLFSAAIFCLMLSTYDQTGLAAAVAVSVIVLAICLLLLMRLEPLEFFLTSFVAGITFAVGLVLIYRLGFLVASAVQVFST